MERGRQEGRSSGAGSVIKKEFEECGHSGETGGEGQGARIWGVRSIHPEDADRQLVMCPKHPSPGPRPPAQSPTLRLTGQVGLRAQTLVTCDMGDRLSDTS